MMVPFVDFEEPHADCHGSIGAFVEGKPEPPKPIGFRMPEPPPDPSWMLLP